MCTASGTGTSSCKYIISSFPQYCKLIWIYYSMKISAPAPLGICTSCSIAVGNDSLKVVQGFDIPLAKAIYRPFPFSRGRASLTWKLTVGFYPQFYPHNVRWTPFWPLPPVEKYQGHFAWIIYSMPLTASWMRIKGFVEYAGPRAEGLCGEKAPWESSQEQYPWPDQDRRWVLSRVHYFIWYLCTWHTWTKIS